MAFRIWFGCLILTPTLVIAAPVPKDNGANRLARLYGTPHNPEQLGEFALDGTDLVVKMSDKLQAPATALKGTLRTTQSVTGDFQAIVAVKYTCSRDPLGDKVGGHLGGGLAAWADDNQYMLVNRHHWPSPGAKNGSNWSGGFDIHGAGGGGNTSHGATCEEVPLDQATHVKLRREGKTFITEESRDGGKTWKALTRSDHDLPKTLNVGVCVFNATSSKGTVTFSDYQLTNSGK
jgi:hypothetical protein